MNANAVRPERALQDLMEEAAGLGPAHGRDVLGQVHDLCLRAHGVLGPERGLLRRAHVLGLERGPQAHVLEDAGALRRQAHALRGQKEEGADS